MDTQLDFAWLESATQDNQFHAAEASRIKRLLHRLPDLIDKAISKAKEAKARGAARIRTSWILDELCMFEGVVVPTAITKSSGARANQANGLPPRLRPVVIAAENEGYHVAETGFALARESVKQKKPEKGVDGSMLVV